MPKNISRALVALLATSFLAACQNGSGETADHLRPFNSSSNQFNQKKSAMDMTTLSDSTLSGILQCDEASTMSKIVGDDLYISSTYTSRWQSGVNMPVGVVTDSMAYETQNAGLTSEHRFRIDSASVNGQSALRQAISFKQLCTQDGCSKEDLHYVEGNAFSVIDAEEYFSSILMQAKVNSNDAYNCYAVAMSGDIDYQATLQEGEMSLLGGTHKAVKMVVSHKVDVFCQSKFKNYGVGPDSTYIGEGRMQKVQILLADELPMGGMNSSQPSGGMNKSQPSQSVVLESLPAIQQIPMLTTRGKLNDSLAERNICSRTVLFSGVTLTRGDQVYMGNSQELMNYQLRNIGVQDANVPNPVEVIKDVVKNPGPGSIPGI